MRKAQHPILTVMTVAFVACFAGSAPAQDIYSWWNIPHIAYGGGYTTYLTIRDPHAAPSSARAVWVYLLDNDGRLMPATVSGIGAVPSPQSSFSFTFTLNGNQERSFVITGGSPLQPGSMQIASQGIDRISASARFTSRDATGQITDVVGILPAEPNAEWTISIEKGSSTEYTGVAAANPWSGAQTLNFDFFQNGVRVPGTTTRTFQLPGNGHLAKFWHENDMFGSAWNTFTGVGTLRITSNDTFCATALRGDGTQYSSLPADEGVHKWTATYTETGGTRQSITWAFKTVDGYTFVGWEQNAFNTRAVRLRGVYAWDTGAFHAEWNYLNHDGTRGMILFQGRLSADRRTVTGRRMAVKDDGTAENSVTFTATRTN